MTFVWFLSSQGERHEDHVPAGIFSSLEKIVEVLRKETDDIEVDHEDESVVHFCSYIDDAKEIIDFCYTARRVQINEYKPDILNT